MQNTQSKTTAKILRNILSSTLSIKARYIRLADKPISLDWVGHSVTGVSYMNYRDRGHLYVATFSDKNGITEITEKVVNNRHMYNGNHDQDETDGSPLSDVVKESDLFVIVGKGVDSDLNYTVYKLPNFVEYWQKAENKDIERWSNWLDK